jgi:hypothetical protein
MKRADRLDSLRVVTPCSVPWSSMVGDDVVRFCDLCRKNVYNVAALTRAEALFLIDRAEGRVCMQVSRRADGTIATGDCWEPLRRARKRGIAAFAVALPAVLLAQLGSQAFGLRALVRLVRPPRAAAPVTSTAPVPLPVIPALPDNEPRMLGELGEVAPPVAPAPAQPRKRHRSLRRLPEAPTEATGTLGGLVVLGKMAPPSADE